MKANNQIEETIFEIIDSRKRKVKPCALLRYSPDDGFRIEIDPNVSEKDVPAFFIPFVQKQQFNLNPERSLQWVQERIVPPGRQNLGEVLSAHGINEYSELDLLRSGQGKSSYDDFIVKEIIQKPDYEQKAQEPSPASIGNLISERRKGEGITQKELANRIGIDQPTLSRIESGKTNASLEVLGVVDKALNVGPSLFEALPTRFLWNKTREQIFRLIDSVDHDLGYMYRTAVDKIERYSPNQFSAGSDSAIISHCLRELIDSFPSYEFGKESIFKGKQSAECKALGKVNEELDRLPETKENDESLNFIPIPKELYNALLDYKSIRNDGNQNRNELDAKTLFGKSRCIGAAMASFKTIRDISSQNAHLKREKGHTHPSQEDYIAALENLEASVNSRLGYFFDTKKEIDLILERANRINAKGEYEKPLGRELEKALSMLTDEAMELRFFYYLDNPYWLQPLFDFGAFKPYYKDNGTENRISIFPFGPYLEKCVQSQPDLVAQILSLIETVNCSVARDYLLRICAVLPQNTLHKVIPILDCCITEAHNKNRTIWDVDDYQVIIERLLESDEKKARKQGFDLFKKMVDLRIVDSSNAFLSRTVSVIEPSSYPSFVEAVMKTMNLEKRAAFAGNMLESFQNARGKASNVSSRFVIPSVSLHDLEFHETERDYANTWIKECYRALYELLQRNADYTNSVLSKKPPIVQRILLQVLHDLITSENELDSTIVERLLSQTKGILLSDLYLFDYEFEHELIPLLGTCSRHFTNDETTTLLSHLPALLNDAKSQMEERFRDHPSQEDAMRYIVHKIEKKELAIISQFKDVQLPISWNERLAFLESKYGLFTRVREPYEVQTITGPNSPLSLKKMKAMKAEEIITFLSEWQASPEEQSNLIDSEGLSSVLSSLIKSNPNVFADHMQKVKALKPVYIEGILSGWTDVLRNGGIIPTSDAIDLCSWVSKLECGSIPKDESGFDFMPDGVHYLKRKVAWILEALLDKAKESLEGYALQIIQILIRFFSGNERDHDALTERENKDYWVASYNELTPLAITCTAKWLYAFPNTESTLRKRVLDLIKTAIPNKDIHQADLIALTSHFSFLYASEPNWVEKNKTAFFGGVNPNENQKLALSSIIAFYHPSKEFFELLKGPLMVALDNHPETYPVAAENGTIFNHFLADIGYWIYKAFIQEWIALEDPILILWDNKADADSKRGALTCICGLIKNSSEVPEDAIHNMQTLWDHYAANGSENSLQGSFSLLRSGRFSSKWLKKAILQEAFQRDLSQTIILVSKDIEQLATDDPDWGIRFLKAVIKNDTSIFLHRYHKLAPSILKLYISEGGSPEDPDFRFCMDALGRAGFIELYDIVFGS